MAVTGANAAERRFPQVPSIWAHGLPLSLRPPIIYNRHSDMKQYLDLLDEVLREGTAKEDRTGTGTLSVFGRQLRFDLDQGFPLLTTAHRQRLERGRPAAHESAALPPTLPVLRR